jgi:hypothetical protein
MATPTWPDNRIGPDRTKRNRIGQPETLGYKVPLEPAARPTPPVPGSAQSQTEPVLPSARPQLIFGLASAWGLGVHPRRVMPAVKCAWSIRVGTQ